MVEEQKVIKRCAACRNEKPVSEMKVCMHAQMHNYVCDSKCMNDFYNPPKKPAQQPSRMVEAVDVVAYGDKQQLGALKSQCSASCAVWSAPGRNREPLMTVAQHNRIMAAATPANSRAVLVELLERLALPKQDSIGWTTWNTAQAYQAAKELRALLEQNQ